MSFFVLLLSFLSVVNLEAATVSAGPTTPAPVGAKCKKIHVHKEWRDISVKDRKSYIQAVKCLQGLPSSLPNVTRSRYEDFQVTHIDLTERTHAVGQFLPWHRNFGNLYGKALREECGYKGPMAFWDWSRDADKDKDVPLIKSPIFDPVTGFGGDGVPGTYTLPPDFIPFPFPFHFKGCVQDGPFRDTEYTVHFGPGRMQTDHCLVRGVNETFRENLTSKNVCATKDSANFEEFRNKLDEVIGVHQGGHNVIGGEMTNAYSSAGDPLFYLHHLNLDRIWWKYQTSHPKKLYEISGPSLPFGMSNDTITLDFPIDFPSLGPNLTVRDVMHIRREPNCFDFAY